MKIIVGVSGASGVIMARTLLEALKTAGCEVHLVITDSAKETWKYEVGTDISELEKRADYVYDNKNLAARISSGSFVTDGMIVLPCSMKTLAGIVTGYTDNLLLRAADVCLKEGRKLVLSPREMPLGKLHLKNMLTAAELGCSIVPPMMTFYDLPENMDDHINRIIGKILLQFGLISDSYREYEGN